MDAVASTPVSENLLEDLCVRQWAAKALQTPAPPFGSLERQEVQHLLNHDLEELRRLEQQPAAVEGDPAPLIDLQISVQCQRIILAPIRFLPLELITAIFKRQDEPKDSFQLKDDPFDICSTYRLVSRLWNTAIISTAELWTDHLIRGSEWPTLLRAKQLAIERSAESLINVRFFPTSKQSDRAWMERVVNLLHRTRFLELQFFDSFFDDMGKQLQFAYNLKVLTIHKASGPILERNTPLVTLHSLEALHITETTDILRFRCPSLLRLKIYFSRIREDSLKSFLFNSAATIQILELDDITIIPESADNRYDYDIFLPSMKIISLGMIMGYGRLFRDLFEWSPRLATLDVHLNGDTYEGYERILPSTFHTLTTLKISFHVVAGPICSIVNRLAQEWLVEAKGLQNLTLISWNAERMSPDMNSLIHPMLLRPGHQSTCPSLKKLVLDIDTINLIKFKLRLLLLERTISPEKLKEMDYLDSSVDSVFRPLSLLVEDELQEDATFLILGDLVAEFPPLAGSKQESLIMRIVQGYRRDFVSPSLIG